MSRFEFEINSLEAVVDPEMVSDYVDGKFHQLNKDEKSQIDSALRNAFESVLSQIECLLVVDGQLSNIDNAREIVFSVATFHQLCTSIKRKVQLGMQFDLAFELSGVLVGRQFARKIIKGMCNDKKILDYSGYLQLWGRFDTRAGWGRFDDLKLDPVKKCVSLKIIHPFSTLEDYCPPNETINHFLKGYVYGVIDEGFRMIDYLFRQTKILRLPHKACIVEKVHSDCKGGMLHVEVTLSEPQFQNAYDQLFGFVFHLAPRDLMKLRRALEFSIRDIFGIEGTSYYSIQRILRALLHIDLGPIEIKAAKDLYQRLSDFAHREVEISPEIELEVLENTSLFLTELQYFGISKKIVKMIKRKTENVQLPSQEMVADMEADILALTDIANDNTSDNGKPNKEQVYQIGSRIAKLETIITYYEDHLLDLQTQAAQCGGEMYLEPKQKGLLREYREKLDSFSLTKSNLEQSLEIKVVANQSEKVTP